MTAASGPEPSPDDEWPFIGRAEEIRRLRQRVVDEGASLVLVGPTGVGKTRLARRLVDAAAEAGLARAQVTASRAAAEIPFGAIASLVPAALGPTVGSVDSRADLVHRCVSALAAVGAGRTLVLLVDDGHLLDAASATVLQQAVATGACRLVMTVRHGEPVHDAVVSLWKDGLALRHDIEGLTEA